MTGQRTTGGKSVASTEEAAVARIRERASAVREGEVETALAKLDANGDLSDAERETVERLADRLVESLLTVPESSLRAAAAADDEETVETALELFG
jgi:glutamyl-tRNA reductase